MALFFVRDQYGKLRTFIEPVGTHLDCGKFADQMTVDPADYPKILNAVGLSIILVGTFLLSVEAFRVTRLTRGAESLQKIIDQITSGMGKNKPIPLKWPFAFVSLLMCAAIWYFAPYLYIFTVTPAVFVLVFLLYRFLEWVTKTSADGFAAVIGFLLVFAGTACQLIALVIEGY